MRFSTTYLLGLKKPESANRSIHSIDPRLHQTPPATNLKSWVSAYAFVAYVFWRNFGSPPTSTGESLYLNKLHLKYRWLIHVFWSKGGLRRLNDLGGCMKIAAYLLIILFTLMTRSEVEAQAPAQVTSEYSGFWWLPAHNGSGFSLTVVSPTRAIAYWYTFDPFGGPMWIIGDGQIIGNTIVGEARVFFGMKFGEWDPADREDFNWGTFEFTFNSCTSGTFTYDSTLSYQSGETFGSGQFPIQRLASTHGLQCSPKPQAGIYQGLFYSNVKRTYIPGMGIISPDGKFAAVSFEAMVSVGNWSVSGSNFSGSGKAVSADPDFTFSANLTLSGQISSGYRLEGTYNVSGGDNGYFDFFAVPGLYRRGFNLQSISGNYTAKNLVSGGTGSVSVSTNGGLTGSDSFGCQYNGQLTVPDPKFNMFQVSVTVSSCGGSNGTYSGYGAQTDYYNLDDGKSLTLVATNNTYAGLIELYLPQ